MHSAIAATLLVGASGNIATFEAILRNGYVLAEDQFASPEDIPPLTSPEIVVGFSDGKGRDLMETSAIYIYEQGEFELMFAPSRDSNVMDTILTRDPLAYWSSAVIYSQVEATRTGMAENGFGQKFRVTYFEGQVIKLEFDHGSKPSKAGLRFKKTMPPAEARRLSSDAKVRIHLKEPQEMLFPRPCEYTLTSATFAAPRQVNKMECAISSEVAAIEIFDSRNGEVLARMSFDEGEKRIGIRHEY